MAFNLVSQDYRIQFNTRDISFNDFTRRLFVPIGDDNVAIFALFEEKMPWRSMCSIRDAINGIWNTITEAEDVTTFEAQREVYLEMCKNIVFAFEIGPNPIKHCDGLCQTRQGL